MKRHQISYLLACLLLMSCSMTKNIPDGEQLFTGLTAINYEGDLSNEHAQTMQEEVEAALATTPNGSLFGSSYHSMPFSWRLWVYNTYAGKSSKFAKWMTKSFGKAPVLMSQVNPALRASVAQSVLRNNGYFRGNVTYETVPQKNPKKSKISYTVRMDSLFILDSIAYIGFPKEPRLLVDSTLGEAAIRKGEPFSVATLDEERSRINTLLRNNGYYFYSNSYASYLADTFDIAGKVQLRFQLANDLPAEAFRKWYIGNIDVHFRKSMREQLADSIHRRHLKIFYNGKHSPIRPGVILRDLSLRPGQEYSYEKYQESASKINATGVFSSVDFQFTPRQDSTATSAVSDTLDLRLNCVFDKPYDFYVESNLIGRTIGRYGPELKLGFTKRNAFRGGEKLDINLHGAYEWQRSGSSDMSSYQYGADASVEFPRIITPFNIKDRVRRDRNGRPRRRRFYTTPTTLAKISTDIVRRPEYYKMHIVTGEWTYRWQTSAQSQHEFSPLTVKYQFMNSSTDKFDSVMIFNPYLIATMEDYFIPKMRYTYLYTSPSTYRNPIRWETTLEESGNLTSLAYVATGSKWNEEGKELFKNPYSQFIRLETDFVKTWQIGTSSQLVGHLNAGAIVSYGNSSDAPFSEMFYAGGANSIRAFTVRSIGPGAFSPNFNKQWAYLMQNGETKLVGNLEYRTRLFGDLHGAVFLDMGNVWNWKDLTLDDTDDEGTGMIDAMNSLFKDTRLSLSKLFDQMALGTGVGLRYDLGFLVIRVDWGYALHMPYDTGKSGYFNVNKFKDAHTLHFAIGYPF